MKLTDNSLALRLCGYRVVFYILSPLFCLPGPVRFAPPVPYLCRRDGTEAGAQGSVLPCFYEALLEHILRPRNFMISLLIESWFPFIRGFHVVSSHLEWPLKSINGLWKFLSYAESVVDRNAASGLVKPNGYFLPELRLAVMLQGFEIWITGLLL